MPGAQHLAAHRPVARRNLVLLAVEDLRPAHRTRRADVREPSVHASRVHAVAARQVAQHVTVLELRQAYAAFEAEWARERAGARARALALVARCARGRTGFRVRVDGSAVRRRLRSAVLVRGEPVDGHPPELASRLEVHVCGFVHFVERARQRVHERDDAQGHLARRVGGGLPAHTGTARSIALRGLQRFPSANRIVDQPQRLQAPRDWGLAGGFGGGVGGGGGNDGSCGGGCRNGGASGVPWQARSALARCSHGILVALWPHRLGRSNRRRDCNGGVLGFALGRGL
mmetsp:Transcript_6939/g.28425  ORF Transcript_6939/g.28425 Transcript_6939/m.28425 type:complete len:287 (-) Transcript_6939:509-1369(-)